MGKAKSKDFTWFGIFPSLPWAVSSWRAGLGLYSPEFSSTTRDEGLENTCCVELKSEEAQGISAQLARQKATDTGS